MGWGWESTAKTPQLPREPGGLPERRTVWSLSQRCTEHREGGRRAKRTEVAGTELQSDSLGTASGGLDNGKAAVKDTRQDWHSGSWPGDDVEGASAHWVESPPGVFGTLVGYVGPKARAEALQPLRMEPWSCPGSWSPTSHWAPPWGRLGVGAGLRTSTTRHGGGLGPCEPLRTSHRGQPGGRDVYRLSPAGRAVGALVFQARC